MKLSIQPRGSNTACQKIKIRYTHQNKTAYINTDISIPASAFQEVPEKWIKPTEPAFEQHNVQLLRMLNKVKEYCADYRLRHNQYPPSNTLSGFFNTKQQPVVAQSLGTLSAAFIHYATHRSNRQISMGRVAHYKVLFTLLQEYAPNFNANEITTLWIGGFRDFLLQKGYGQNTTMAHISTLRAFLNWMISERHTTLLPSVVNNVSITWQPRDIIYHTTSELRQLFSVNLSEYPELESVRDAYLLQCLTGLRHGDTKDSRWSVSPDNFLIVQPEKTRNSSGRVIRIALDSDAAGLIRKYYSTNQPFPFIPTKEYNEGIKRLGELAGISKNVTLALGRKKFTVGDCVPKYQLMSSHVARATAICQLIQHKIPVFDICSMVGISLNTIKHYAVVSDDSIRQTVNSVFERRGSLAAV